MARGLGHHMVGGHVCGMRRSGVYYYGEDGATTFEYVHAELTPAAPTPPPAPQYVCVWGIS